MTTAHVPRSWRSDGVRRIDLDEVRLSSDALKHLPGLDPGVHVTITSVWQLAEKNLGVVATVRSPSREIVITAEVVVDIYDLSESEISVLRSHELSVTEQQVLGHLVLQALPYIELEAVWELRGARRQDLSKRAADSIAASGLQETLTVRSVYDLAPGVLGMVLTLEDDEGLGSWCQRVRVTNADGEFSWESSMPVPARKAPNMQALRTVCSELGGFLSYEMDVATDSIERYDIASVGVAKRQHPEATDAEASVSIARAMEQRGKRLLLYVDLELAGSNSGRILVEVSRVPGSRADVRYSMPCMHKSELDPTLVALIEHMVVEYASWMFFDGEAIGLTRCEEFTGAQGSDVELVHGPDGNVEERVVTATVLEAWHEDGASFLIRFLVDRGAAVQAEVVLRTKIRGAGPGETCTVEIPRHFRVDGAEHHALSRALKGLVNAYRRANDEREAVDRPDLVVQELHVGEEDGERITIKPRNVVAFGDEEVDVQLTLVSGSGQTRDVLVTYYDFRYLVTDDSEHICRLWLSSAELTDLETQAVFVVGAHIRQRLIESGDWNWSMGGE